MAADVDFNLELNAGKLSVPSEIGFLFKYLQKLIEISPDDISFKEAKTLNLFFVSRKKVKTLKSFLWHFKVEKIKVLKKTSLTSADIAQNKGGCLDQILFFSFHKAAWIIKGGPDSFHELNGQKITKTKLGRLIKHKFL